jgi:hypothetical protein
MAAADYRDDLAVGSFSVTIPIAVLVSVNVPRKQTNLFDYVGRTGTRSVFAALDGFQPFDDVTVNVLSLEPLGQQEVGGSVCWGAQINVAVMAGG